MSPTTSYGTWNNHGDPNSLTVADSVVAALDGANLPEFDVDGIVEDYRTAINDLLPDSVQLCGEEFIGPADDQDWEGYPVDMGGALDLRAIVDQLDGDDFWAIVRKHER